MNAAREKHREAMALADQALAARQLGDQTEAKTLFRRALEYEKHAAEVAASELAVEPTRSVLYRSAATLALDCEEFREAERLIAVALAGNPPEEIADELRELLDRVYFQRHLELHGVVLGAAQFQLSLAGSAVGPGVTRSASFIERLQAAERLVRRTAERRRGQPFRERGPARAALRDVFEVYLEAPRAASFAVTIRLGRPIDQLMLPGTEDTADVIDEMFRCLDLVSRSDQSGLQARIRDEAYYRNFVGLVRRIAPDGNDVKLVGFTTMRAGQATSVALTAPGPEIAIPSEIVDGSGKVEAWEVTGVLQYADARDRARGIIQVIDEKGRAHKVTVPEGMMADIVRPLWEDTVTVTGRRTGKTILLEDIRRA